ncbi:MAG TPA: hypothetical protein PLL69_04270 [Gemmatimonadales bacterium]|nr:hypothetical protein [Gemmatimonadales bacterium]
MSTIAAGIALIAGWAVLQFAVQPTTGWIHVLLIAGVIAIIRGIVLRDAARD